LLWALSFPVPFSLFLWSHLRACCRCAGYCCCSGSASCSCRRQQAWQRQLLTCAFGVNRRAAALRGELGARAAALGVRAASLDPAWCITGVYRVGGRLARVLRARGVCCSRAALARALRSCVSLSSDSASLSAALLLSLSLLSLLSFPLLSAQTKAAAASSSASASASASSCAAWSQSVVPLLRKGELPAAATPFCSGLRPAWISSKFSTSAPQPPASTTRGTHASATTGTRKRERERRGPRANAVTPDTRHARQ